MDWYWYQPVQGGGWLRLNLNRRPRQDTSQGAEQPVQPMRPPQPSCMPLQPQIRFNPFRVEGYPQPDIRQRFKALRCDLEAGRISTSEYYRLQQLAILESEFRVREYRHIMTLASDLHNLPTPPAGFIYIRDDQGEFAVALNPRALIPGRRYKLIRTQQLCAGIA